jgi:hypothetical protein
MFSARGVPLNVITASVQLLVLRNSVYLSAQLKLRGTDNTSTYFVNLVMKNTQKCSLKGKMQQITKLNVQSTDTRSQERLNQIQTCLFMLLLEEQYKTFNLTVRLINICLLGRNTVRTSKVNRRFGEIYHLHIQGRNVSQTSNQQ